MNIALQPLLNRTELLPDESLPSFLRRLTELNLYESHIILRDLILEELKDSKTPRDNLELPTKSTTYEKLTALTGLDASSLYMATLHRFALILTPPPESVSYLQLSSGHTFPGFPKGYIRKLLRFQKTVQFCPQCLKEKAYYTLRWSPIAISACLRHQCILVDRCQGCNHSISLVDLINKTCNKCKLNLTQTETISIANDKLGLLAQNVIQSWFMTNATPTFASSMLPNATGAVLYKIIEDLRSSLEKIGNRYGLYLQGSCEKEPMALSYNFEGNEVMTPYESYQLYTTAFKGLIDWPHGFYNFLDDYRHQIVSHQDLNYNKLHYSSQKGGLITGAIRDSFDYLYTNCICQFWLHKDFEFIQKTFNFYIADNYWLDYPGELVSFCKKHPDIAEKCQWVDLHAAAQFLEMSPNTLEILLENEQVKHITSAKDTVTLVKKKTVFSFSQTNSQLMPLGRVVRFLGIKESVVKDLAGAGLIERAYNTRRQKHMICEEYTLTSVTEFLEKILQATKYYDPDEIADRANWLDLLETTHLLSSVKLNMITIFIRLMSGQLWAYHAQNQRYRLSNLLFKFVDIETLIDSE